MAVTASLLLSTSLTVMLAAARVPVYVAGPIASSDRLIKDPESMLAWLQTARNLCVLAAPVREEAVRA